MNDMKKYITLLESCDDKELTEARPEMSRWIPDNAVEIKDDESSAVAYTYELANGKLVALGYRGKRTKNDFHYAYKDAERREKSIQTFFDGVRASETATRERRVERTAAPRGADVGDILSASWGYDQTNVNFYQIIKLVGKFTVVIREVGSKHTDDSHVVASPDSFIGDEKRIRLANGSGKVGSSQYVSVWDGKPAYETPFGYGH